MRIVKFANPPLVEMVCGLLLEPMTSFQEREMALLWHAWHDSYPNLRTTAPTGRPSIPDVVPLVAEELPRPPVARAIMTNENGDWTVTVDQNRFTVNWVGKNGASYPGFDKVYRMLQRRFAQLKTILEEAGCEVRPVACEIHYVADVPLADFAKGVSGIAQLLPWIAWPMSAPMDALSNFRWEAEMRPADMHGHLQVSVRTLAKDDEVRIIRLETIARGPYVDGDERSEWFKVAHRHLVTAFMGLVSEDLQTTKWGRHADD